VVGVSGEEGLVVDAIADELDGFHDRRESDPLGNTHFIRSGAEGAPSVMLCAHMDEIGFIVQHVEDEGFVRLAPVGYHDDRMAINQQLRIHTDDGHVDGVTGTKPPHVLTDEESKHVIKLPDLHMDIGVSSRAEAEELGVRVGNRVTFATEGRLLNGTRVFTGKAVDDRAGCAVMVETLRRLADRDVAATVIGTASVQEELGIWGAGPAAFRVQPDIALAIDVTLCGDTPGTEFSRLPIRLGGGPAIKYLDWAPSGALGNTVPRRLTKRLEQAADTAGIAYQREVLIGGGTDASSIARAAGGFLAGCISVPSRYIHSAVGCVHLDDLDGAVELLAGFIEGVTEPL